jgi:hypothetical protein
MYQAWTESNPGMSDSVRREQGGWIYARNGKILIRRAAPGISAEINLENPPQIKGAMLVGNFHTHPGFAAQGYNSPIESTTDLINATWRGVPGLIIREGKIVFNYGPSRRGADPDLALDPSNPKITGYPGNSANLLGCP